MRRTALAALAAATVALAIAVPAEAQSHRGAFGVNAGGTWFSALNDDRAEQFARLGLRPSWTVGAQLDQWFGNGRIGLRANALYSGPTLQMTGTFIPDNNQAAQTLDESLGTMNVWAGNLDFMLRLLTPRIDRTFAPYLAVGGGVVHYNAPESDMVFEEANAEFQGSSETLFAPVIALGTDIFFGRFLGAPWMLRLEAADHIAWDSPVRRLDTGERYNEVHNFRGTIGLHLLYDPIAPPVVVAPPPPPPPPVEPAPPPPPPVEETILVCVIDPAAPGGIRMVEAIHVPATGERFVIRDGVRVPFESVLPTVTLARDADWFVRGEPLVIDHRDWRSEFVTFGAPRVIEADDLVFLGTVNGLPVYGSRADVDPVLAAPATADLRHRLEDARRAEAFGHVDVLYVPAEVEGCVFIPLERVEVVRKIRG